MPDIGEGTTEAEIVAWHVKVGDIVTEDDPLAEVMTDKATVEIPSPVAGTVVALHGEPGEKLPVGADWWCWRWPEPSPKPLRVPKQQQNQPLTLPLLPQRAPPSPAKRERGNRLRRKNPSPAMRERVPRPKRKRGARRVRVVQARLARPGFPVAKPSPRQRCASEPGTSASSCNSSPAPAPAGASPTKTSTPTPRRAGVSKPRALQRWPGATGSRRSRSSVCAARSPSICRRRSGASRISPMSRRSTSPRSKNCARTSTRPAPSADI